MASSKHSRNLLGLHNTLNQLPGNAPALATNPDATALDDTGNIAELGNQMSRGNLLILAGEQERLIHIVNLDVPSPLLLIIRNLGTDTGALGHVRLLGSLHLGVLQGGEEGVLQNALVKSLAPPGIGIGNGGIQHRILELLHLIQESVGVLVGVSITGERQRNAVLAITDAGGGVYEITDTPGVHHRGGCR